MLKDNIMKLTDGLFGRVFDEVSAEYPDIVSDSQIIDIGSARLADSPQTYDVIVTLNLYGDIISDIAAEISGSVGMAGSANIGTDCAMFEAIHGSAPDIADLNVANPSGLIQAASMMLVHIGQSEVAAKILNAWRSTIEDGIHTADIYQSEKSEQLVGTEEFADAVIARLGNNPTRLEPVKISQNSVVSIPEYTRKKQKKVLTGVDVFIEWPGDDSNEIGNSLKEISADGELKLKMITNRGVKVYPDGLPETFLTDHWRCRYILKSNDQEVNGSGKMLPTDIIDLLKLLDQQGWEVIKTENLYEFDNEKGYSLGQGE
jgi:isocitrate dehydrogenase